ncbi:TPA: transposase [Klebsiella oxytoca]
MAGKLGEVCHVLCLPDRHRKVIDTTNAIESLNITIRHAIRKRKVFPINNSVNKGPY